MLFIQFIKKSLQYFDSHSGAILAFLTLALVLITFWYAVQTQNMSKTMLKQVDLESRPYVGIDRDITVLVRPENPMSEKNATKTDWFQVQYSIVNLGKVAIKFQTKDVYAHYEINSLNTDNGVVLYPSQSIFHTTQTIKIPETAITDFKENIELEVVYWAVDVPEKKYFHTRTFNLIGKSYEIVNDNIGELN